MKKTREFGEGPLYTFLNYFVWIFLDNLYFLLCNILLILYAIFYNGNVSELGTFLLYLCLIPMGPALTANFASMGKIVRDKDIDMLSYFFKSYRTNFKQSISLWFLQLTFLFIIGIDLNFFAQKSYGGYFVPVFFFMAAVILIVGLNAFPILSRFYMKTADILKISFVYSIKKFQITIFNIIAVLCGIGLMYILPSISLFYVVGLVSFLVMNNNKKIIEELTDLFEKDNENKNEIDNN